MLRVKADTHFHRMDPDDPPPQDELINIYSTTSGPIYGRIIEGQFAIHNSTESLPLSCIEAWMRPRTAADVARMFERAKAGALFAEEGEEILLEPPEGVAGPMSSRWSLS